MKIVDVLTKPWAIQESKLQEITSIYDSRLRGEKINFKEFEAATGIPLENNQPTEFAVTDGVALIGVDGVLAKKMNMFMKISGGSSMQIIGDQIRAAVEDESVKAIILNIDSPGGTVDGTEELAETIFNARGQKPIVSFVDGMMASAAFWIGAAADKIILSGKTNLVGSVGVIAQHIDQSKFNEKQGVKVTNIITGKLKDLGTPHKELSEDGLAAIQGEVNQIFSVFISSLARFRNVSEGVILEKLGDAKILVGEQAIDAGVVDGVSTLSTLINELSGSGGDSLDGGGSFHSLKIKGKTMSGKKLETTENPELTADEFKANFPGQFKVIQDSIKADAHALGVAAGADAERKRILAIEDLSMPGCEQLVKELKADGTTTPEQAAVKIVKAAKVAAPLQAFEHDLKEDADNSLMTPEATEPGDTGPIDPGTPAEQMRAKWDKSAALQASYNGNYESFEAFEKNYKEGNVKIQGEKRVR